MLQDFLSNPLIYWAVILGLVCTTSIVLASMGFLLRAASDAWFLARSRHTFTQLSALLTTVAVRNEEINPDLSTLAKLLSVQLDPASSLYTADVEQVKQRLNLRDEDVVNVPPGQ